MSSCLVKLAESKNSKNRNKSACIMKILLDCYESVQDEVDQNCLSFGRSILTVLRAQLSSFKESKMQLNSLLMAKRVFATVLRADKRFGKGYKASQGLLTDSDLEQLDVSKQISIKLDDWGYLNMRVR